LVQRIILVQNFTACNPNSTTLARQCTRRKAHWKLLMAKLSCWLSLWLRWGATISTWGRCCCLVCSVNFNTYCNIWRLLCYLPTYL